MSSKTSRIRVLIAEDSPVVQKLMEHLLSSDPRIEVVGIASNGAEAIAMAAELRPDVITMDIQMPKIDGLQATREIMETAPAPIVIVSSATRPEEVELTFKAMEAGAVSVLEKPHGPGMAAHDQMARQLLQTVRLMAEVRVVRRWRAKESSSTHTNYKDANLQAQAASQEPGTERPQSLKRSMVLLIASTGGPPALSKILSQLPDDLAAPVIVVQHMTPGFLAGMVDWLQKGTRLPISIAMDKEIPIDGHVYFAPDGYHLGFSSDGSFRLSAPPPEHGVRPSGSSLLRSAAPLCMPSSAAVVLTGMGRDAAMELGLLRQAGALTIAQDSASSVVYGMPGEAARLKTSKLVLPLDEIASAIVDHVGRSR